MVVMQNYATLNSLHRNN